MKKKNAPEETEIKEAPETGKPSVNEKLKALGYDVAENTCKRFLAEKNGKKMFLFARARDEYHITDDMVTDEGETEICVAFHEGGEGPAKTCLARRWKGKDLAKVLDYERILDKQCAYVGMTRGELNESRSLELTAELEKTNE